MKPMIAIAMLVALSVSGQAQQCSTVVVDESGVLKGQEATVELAAKPLQEMGAEVRVRTLQSMQGSPNLDHFVQTLVGQCPSWQNSVGSRKGNLLLFVQTKQEKAAGIYSGLEFKQPVDANYVRIIADHMKPKFRQDDHTGAMVAGLNETHRVVYQHLHPGAQVSTTFVNMGDVAQAVGILGGAFILAMLIFYLVKWRVFSKRRAKIVNQLAPAPLTPDELRGELDKLVPSGSTKEEFVTIFHNMTTQQDKAKQLRKQAEELIE
jgi:uncharacterized membrane protein YgcG